MNPETTAILAKSPYYAIREWAKVAADKQRKTKGRDMTEKCLGWEDVVRIREMTYGQGRKSYGTGEAIQKEAVRMGATIKLNNSPEASETIETASSDIQIRLEILKILFSSPYIGTDHGLTTKQVENWVKTGEGVGIVFVEWNK